MNKKIIFILLLLIAILFLFSCANLKINKDNYCFDRIYNFIIPSEQYFGGFQIKFDNITFDNYDEAKNMKITFNQYVSFDNGFIIYSSDNVIESGVKIKIEQNKEVSKETSKISYKIILKIYDINDRELFNKLFLTKEDTPFSYYDIGVFTLKKQNN